MPSVDVLVVGTRCAGAALAMLLARAGVRVLGVDRAAFPSDTLSTHFLWPRTTAFLARWGLLEALAATGCPPIDRVDVDYGGVVIRGRPSPVEGTAAMYCPRRTVLDSLLVEAAREAGADLWPQTTFRSLIWRGGRVVGAQLERGGRSIEVGADLVIGADGLWSPVARAAGAAIELEHPTLTCGYYAYWTDLPTDGVEFYVREGRDILVFPTHAGMTCVWAGRARDAWTDYRGDVEGGYRAIVGSAPGLAARLETAQRASPFRGTARLPNQYRRGAGPGWALVGDAAYHRDPLTGMGIGDAFLGAELLTAAILEAARDADRFDSAGLDGALEGYRLRLRERTRPIFDYRVKAGGLADPSAMRLLPDLRLASRPVEHDDLMTARDQVSGHRPTHAPEAEKCEFCHCADLR